MYGGQELEIISVIWMQKIHNAHLGSKSLRIPRLHFKVTSKLENRFWNSDQTQIWFYYILFGFIRFYLAVPHYATISINNQIIVLTQ